MTDPTADSAATPASSQTPPKSSVFDDLVEVAFSPRNVFARSAKKGFGAAFFIIWILISVVAFSSRSTYQPVLDAQMAKARAQMAEKNPTMTADQLALGEKIGGYIAMVAVVAGPPIAILLLGLFIWIVGRIFGASISAGQGMLIATYSFVPRFLGSLVVLGLSFVSDASNATNMAAFSLGPARFVSPTTGATTMALLSRIDVSVFWGTALIAIAYATIGKLKSSTAWGAAILLWALGALPALLGALRQ